MSSPHTVTLDTKSLSAILDNLNEDNRRAAMLSALRSGGKVLQEQTKESLKRKLGSGATSTSGTAVRNSVLTNIGLLMYFCG